MIYTVPSEQIVPVPKEAWRYAGYPAGMIPEQEMQKVFTEAQQRLKAVLRPGLVYDEFDLKVDSEKNEVRFAERIVVSEKLTINLRDCRKVVLFAATIGSSVDMLTRTIYRTDAAKGSIYQATGAMYIESFVDMFNDWVKKEHSGNTKPRFSPGFGDVPLSVQKIFFELLPCSKIGLTLMDSLIMAPEKSVTAFIGLK